MNTDAPWWETYFDADFIRLYGPLLPQEVSREEAAGIVELLALKPGSRVLDLACGWGRHAVELAALGCDVVAADQATELLDLGRGAAEHAGLEVEWVQGDIRKLEWEPEFDAVVSIFSSLGYSGTDEDDIAVLRRARQALNPDGFFLLETMHRDQVAREYAERDWWETEDGEPVWVERQFDAVLGVSREWLRWQANGSIQEKYHEIRIRSATEWADLLHRSGLQPLAWYGGWDLSAFGLEAERLIVIAEAADSIPE